MDIQPLKSLKVLVLGDSCIDRYKFGQCERLSPEAPVPILRYGNQYEVEGMAGNVKNNLLAFGLDVDIICNHRKIVKERLIDLKTNQHLLRIDYEENLEPLKLEGKNFLEYSAVIISDYNKGTIDSDVMSCVKSSYNGPIFVDTKKRDLSIFEDCIIKINENENENIKTYPKNCELIVTLGDKGSEYKGKVYSTKKVNVFDVTGAGDTFLAGLVAKYLLTNDIESSIPYANLCAAQTIQKPGTAIIEIKDDLCI